MSTVTVLGATGYAGAAIVAEAAARGHRVTALSRTAPAEPVDGVDHVQGDATDGATLASVIEGADVVVGALGPRGPLADRFREVYPTVARLADAAGAAFYVVGRYRLGDDVAVGPAGGAISAPDYALGLVDLIEKGDHHRTQVNLAN